VVERKSILVRLPPAIKQGVDDQAKESGVSRNKIIVEAVTLYLKDLKNGPKPTRDTWWK